MGRKKKRPLPCPHARIFCYYCDRTFSDEQTLLSHQREKHLRCPICHKRMLSIPSMTIHASQMHNHTVPTIPNAISGRDHTSLDVLGMNNIPPEYYDTLERAHPTQPYPHNPQVQPPLPKLARYHHQQHQQQPPPSLNQYPAYTASATPTPASYYQPPAAYPLTQPHYYPPTQTPPYPPHQFPQYPAYQTAPSARMPYALHPAYSPYPPVPYAYSQQPSLPSSAPPSWCAPVSVSPPQAEPLPHIQQTHQIYPPASVQPPAALANPPSNPRAVPASAPQPPVQTVQYGPVLPTPKRNATSSLPEAPLDDPAKKEEETRVLFNRLDVSMEESRAALERYKIK